MNARDMREFIAYLRQCTNTQVLGVIERERAAGRADYLLLAESEAISRGIL